MKASIISGWNAMRILRTVMGIVALIFAFIDKDFLLGAAGGLLLGMGIMNISCCGVSGCSVNSHSNRKVTKKGEEEIQYEEVV
ncbi:MAG: hypothetical protein IT249_05285 [Chitinophagaceae bacterium]|nr:hypothetical protein [Chitinophagaceae bacterium]